MRRASFVFRAVFLPAICCLLAASARAETDASFSRANQEFADGKFQEAIGDYKAMATAGPWSAALFYNLGNAYFRTHEFGQAILSYERALVLEPNHPETQANLRVARDEARALELVPNWTERFRRLATTNQFVAGAAVLFWIGIFMAVAAIFGKRRHPGLVILSVCSLLLCFFTVAVIRSMEIGPRGRGLAVVTTANVQARLATADTATSVLMLPAGSEVEIEQERGDWVYAVLPNDLRGWIPAAAIERVRL